MVHQPEMGANAASIIEGWLRPSCDAVTYKGRDVVQRAQGAGARVHTAPLVSVWCWYRVGSGDEGPGRTGVSHWVEHMNFKGTRNIPRDDMKGIVERFGGTWNGYTWIDQTTYLETAGTGRPRHSCSSSKPSAWPRPLRAGRSASRSGRSSSPSFRAARTIRISCSTSEVTATAFRAHPYRHPTIGWLDDLQVDDPRRSLRALPPPLRSRTTPRWSSSATSTPTTCCAAPSGHFGKIAAADAPPRICARRAAAARRTPRRGRASRARPPI